MTAGEEAGTLDRLSLVGQEITASFAFEDIFAAIERQAGVLLGASTLYIGLLDPTGAFIDVPLFVDGGRRAPSRRFRLDDPVRPASQAVREGREILREKTLEEAIATDIPGTTPTLSALFRPLTIQGRTIGVMSVQSTRAGAYGERERVVFRALCSYAAVALANAESFRRLAALEPLEALGEVGQEITGSLDPAEVHATLERHMSRLLAPSAFHLALLDAEGARLAYPLAVARGERYARAPLPVDDPQSPDARALREGREVEVAAGETSPVARVSLHRPLVARSQVIGVLAVETDRPEGFDERQKLIFRTLCASVAIAIANAAAYREAQLAWAEADRALAELRRAQQGLIEAEKMASLGAIVAGVAHEVNTPVGTALTVATTLERLLADFRPKLDGGALRRSDLNALVEGAAEAARQLTANLSRASDLVSRFKQVAADRTSDERRSFLLDELVGAILTSLTSELKRGPHRLDVDVPAGIVLDSFPGALGQVLVNLVMNALVHAFPDGRAGTIALRAEPGPDGAVTLILADDGAGVPAENLHRIFEPFFTTRRDQGGTGLGLYIAYNLAGQVLGGRLACSSGSGGGSTFTLTMPRVVPLTGGRI